MEEGSLMQVRRRRRITRVVRRGDGVWLGLVSRGSVGFGFGVTRLVDGIWRGKGRQ